MYKNISSLFLKLWTKSTSTALQPKKRSSVILSELDQLIFRRVKPNAKFLERTYGFHARLIHAKKTNNNYSWNGQSLYQDQIMLLPFMMIGINKLTEEKSQCQFDTSLRRNHVESRVVLIQYAANKPIEDRYKVSQLTSADGYAVSVFDGHGGWQVAELAMRRVHDEFNRLLGVNKKKYSDQDDWVQESLKEAYNIVEQEFIEVARPAYQMGFAAAGRVGSCALTAVVINNKLYSANLGDSKGIIVNIDEKGKPTFRKINHMLNANSKKEQRRLKTIFPDNDIIVQRHGATGACYVKNRLMPTRAFGDLLLKLPEFNNPQKHSTDKGFYTPLEPFNGPYINHIPDQKVFDLQKGDRYLVMGSDGLWDELTKQNVADLASRHVGNKDELIKAIFNESFKHAAQNNKMTEEQLREVPLGKRRDLHDDITIIVVDLANQI